MLKCIWSTMSVASYSYLIEPGDFNLLESQCLQLLLAGVYQKHAPAFTSPARCVLPKTSSSIYISSWVGFTKNKGNLSKQGKWENEYCSEVTKEFLVKWKWLLIRDVFGNTNDSEQMSPITFFCLRTTHKTLYRWRSCKSHESD